MPRTKQRPGAVRHVTVRQSPDVFVCRRHGQVKRLVWCVAQDKDRWRCPECGQEYVLTVDERYLSKH